MEETFFTTLIQGNCFLGNIIWGACYFCVPHGFIKKIHNPFSKIFIARNDVFFIIKHKRISFIFITPFAYQFLSICNLRSSLTEKLGIRFEFVPDGIYDRKATRTNRKEADALVKYIFDRLERANGNYRSIGVVTFSQAQKELIEDLVEKERGKHPALESYFSETQEEPLFVKNLENVQGDERDVILFSIGYAPDAKANFQ